MEPQLLAYLERIAVALEGIRFHVSGLRGTCETFLEDILNEAEAEESKPLHFPTR